MTSPARPWWQLYLDGLAERGAEIPGKPGFVDVVGVEPEGWEPEGVVRLRWRPPANLRTPGGWVQGGFLGVVLDMAQTFAIFTQVPEMHGPMTLEMKVSFVETSLADDYVVTGRVIRLGRHVAHADGTLHDAGGRLVATSTSTHVIRRLG